MGMGKHGTQMQGMVVLYTIAALLFKNSVKPIDTVECSFVSGQ
jgi:hypothetical protein